jgi:hypothetical protein
MTVGEFYDPVAGVPVPAMLDTENTVKLPPLHDRPR